LVAPVELLDMAERVNSPMHDFNMRAQQAPMTATLKYSHADCVYNLAPPFANAVRRHFGLEPLPEHESQLLQFAAEEDAAGLKEVIAQSVFEILIADGVSA